jgi:hypothetical protein
MNVLNALKPFPDILNCKQLNENKNQNVIQKMGGITHTSLTVAMLTYVYDYMLVMLSYESCLYLSYVIGYMCVTSTQIPEAY